MTNMKKALFESGIIVCIFIFTFLLFFAGYKYGRQEKTRIVHVDFSDTINPENNEQCRYKFMPPELSIYIEKLSKELDIDCDLVVAILLVENPSFNPDAEHKNNNGTWDVGLWQLNDKYLYQTFLPSYWDLQIEFNPYNAKHNTFIALHHIQYLSERLKVQEDIIAAYNAGIGAVMNNEIPFSTKYYVIAVQNNYNLLKEKNND